MLCAVRDIGGSGSRVSLSQALGRRPGRDSLRGGSVTEFYGSDQSLSSKVGGAGVASSFRGWLFRRKFVSFREGRKKCLPGLL